MNNVERLMKIAELANRGLSKNDDPEKTAARFLVAIFNIPHKYTKGCGYPDDFSISVDSELVDLESIVSK